MTFDFHVDPGDSFESAVENVEVVGFNDVFVVGVIVGSHA
jgi:hypothetical protein